MARPSAWPMRTAESGLTRYLEEIRRVPMLTRPEEYLLAKRWREHGDREFGVSRERVRQIDVRSFGKVQKAAKNHVTAMESPAPLPLH
jgi:DNA-directed RNA polymerase sigma subunit (sigma70/sigma32)